MARQGSDNGNSSTKPNSENEPDPQPEKHTGPQRPKFAKAVSTWFVGIVSGLISGAIVTFAITANRSLHWCAVYADDASGQAAKLH